MKYIKNIIGFEIIQTLIVITFVLHVTSLDANAQDPCPDAPAFETTQYFCSEEVWAKIGEDADFLGDLPIYAEQPDYVLNWYRDAALNERVNDPKKERLTDGNTYYVTQINKDGCESDPLKVDVFETECGCIKDPGFEDQNGNPSARGYEFYRFDDIANHKTCGQSMNGASRVTLGAIDGYTWQDNVTLVTPGFDPPHRFESGNIILTLPNLERTNPSNPYSTHALRLNRGIKYGGLDGKPNISSMTKKFIAGEVFAFSFSVIQQNPNHGYVEQPFAQVNLYDEEDNLVQSRCLVSNPNDCIFNKAGEGIYQVLYSDWTCMKLNTLDYIGQSLRAEFITSYCFFWAHYSFMYIDDLYAGDDYDGLCDNSAFGYAIINSVSPAEDVCYVMPEKESEMCSPKQNNNIPGFPIYVCGKYDPPISQGDAPKLEEITLNIIQNDVVVGTIIDATPGSVSNTFCFLVEESDIDTLPYGNFTFEVQTDFALDCGDEYHYYINDRSNYSLCPSAGCPDMLQVCDLKGNGFTIFDLTNHGDMFYNTEWTEEDVILSYYIDENDAHNQTNPISNPESFENTEAFYQMVYIRLDWNVEGASSECYYVVSLDLEVTEIPFLREWKEEVIFCENEEINYPLDATPINMNALKDVDFKWFKDGEQIPHSGNHYYPKEPGRYKVIVSEGDCEISQTIDINQVKLEVSFDEFEVTLCDLDSYTIKPSVKSKSKTEIDHDAIVYLWSTGDTTRDLTVSESGIYTLKVTYGDCIYQESINVNFSYRPEIKTIENIKLCKGTEELVTLNISHPNSDKLNIQWYLDGGLIAENISEIEIDKVGLYKVIAGEEFTKDCYEEVTFNVDYYDNEDCVIPEGLSPNNDGYNDNLDLSFLDNKHGIHSLQIFNRHGLEVYSKDNYTNEWYGQSRNGKILPVGVYFYIIKLNDGTNNITGSIYLNY